MLKAERKSQPDYSELEVVPNTYAHNAEVAQGLEVHYVEHDPKASPTARPPSKDGKIAYDTDKKLLSLAEASDSPEVIRQSQHKDLPPPPSPATTCGLPRKTFWILVSVATIIVAAAAIGGGVGGPLAHRNQPQPTARNQSQPSMPSPPVQNLSIAALHWVDGANTSQYRVYYQLSNASIVTESAWSSDTKNWSVSSITDQGADIKPSSPLACSAGYPHSNTSNALVSTCELPCVA